MSSYTEIELGNIAAYDSGCLARENGSRDFHVLLLINMSRGSAGRRDGKVDQILQGLTCLCSIVSLDASDISFRLKIQETVLTGITR